MQDSSKSHARPSVLKSSVSAFFLALWILGMVCVFFVNQLIGFTNKWRLISLFHAGANWFFNLKVTYHGTLWDSSPTIYVSNHSSYLDVFVLGAKLPGSFIAKSEVSGWPVFGKLATLQGTFFFERNTRRAAKQVTQLREHLRTGESLIFFPEGTSTPGTHVEKFRSSLLAAADLEGVKIQPVSVAYVNYEGQLMDQNVRDNYAWYIPMPFLSHFLNALGLGRVDVKVTLHDPIDIADFDSRKTCATYCEEKVREGLLASLELEEQLIPTHYLQAIGRIQ